MNSRRLGGFALPTVLIASIIMLTVLLVAVTSTAAVRASIKAQYYNQLSQLAGDAGTTYAKACLDANGGVPLWGNGTAYTSGGPLMPDTDCYGTRLASCPASPADAACHSVSINDGSPTTFTVSLPETSAGKAINVNSVGTTNLLRSSDSSSWRTYSQTGKLAFNYSVGVSTWGGTNGDYGYSLVQTNDGGYAVTGQTMSYGAGGYDMFLAKYDSAGTLSWNKTWGGTIGDQGTSLVQTSDGGYAVTGGTYNYGVGTSGDMFLAKYDSAGTLSWSKTWGGTGMDYGNSLVQTNDGGYAVTGQTCSYGASCTDMFLVKYDSAGTLSWNKTWGGTGNDYGQSLVQTSDGGYAVTGQTTSYGAGSYDVFLAKYKSDGSITGCSAPMCQTPTATATTPTATVTTPTATATTPTATVTTPTATATTPTATTKFIVTTISSTTL